MAFMKLPSVWLCFSFFFWSTCALSAIQSFASPAMQAMYGLPLSVTALIVTGYMLCGAAGMVVGGFLVGAAAGEGDIDLHAGLGSAAVCRGHGLVARHGGRDRGLSCRSGHGPGRPLARHADQARRATRRHGPRLRHRLFGPGPGLLPGRSGVRLHAGPPYEQCRVLRLGDGTAAVRGIGRRRGRWREQKNKAAMAAA